MQDEFVTLTAAAEIAGVSRVKLWRMVKDGRLPAYADPRDARVKLIKRAELDVALRPIPLTISEATMGKAAA